MSPHPRYVRRLAKAGALLTLAAASLAATASVPARPDSDDTEAAGALMGDLMFHADLMSTLDKLCPRRGPAADWHAAVSHLPAHARTRELRDLSQRLSAEAARAMVRGSGGCATRDYADVYGQTRRDFEALRERWAWFSI